MSLQISSFVGNILLTELSHNIFSLKSSLKVAYAYELLQQLPTGEEVERKSEREDYIGMVLASAYSPSLQMRLCCLSIPMHRPQEAAAVQPSGALPIAPCLGRQDGAGRSISVGCARCPATNLGSQPDFLPLPPGFVLPWRCKPTGNPADRISGDVFHAEQRRELTHNSDELQ